MEFKKNRVQSEKSSILRIFYVLSFPIKKLVYLFYGGVSNKKTFLGTQSSKYIEIYTKSIAKKNSCVNRKKLLFPFSFQIIVRNCCLFPFPVNLTKNIW